MTEETINYFAIVFASVFVIAFAIVSFIITDKRCKYANERTKTILYQWIELNNYEEANGLKKTPRPTVGRLGNYTYLIPHINQVKHYSNEQQRMATNRNSSEGWE